MESASSSSSSLEPEAYVGAHGAQFADVQRAPFAAECAPSGEVRGEVAVLIPLTPASAGAFAIIDSADFERLGHLGWQLRADGPVSYATAKIARKTVYMHREVLSAGSGQEVDHRNGNGLDNRRGNLRFATPAQNKANRRKTSRPCCSRFKGVRRDPRNARKPWVAIINSTYLGGFSIEEDAARAYDAAAVAKYGEFALTNFPQEVA